MPRPLTRLGLGTHLGECNDEADGLVEAALRRALLGGVRVVDTALIYRCQRAERCIGRVLGDLLADGRLDRDELLVSTKVGLVPGDGLPPSDPESHARAVVIGPGLATPADLVPPTYNCLAPKWIEWSVERSLRNLDLEQIDLVYLHCPENQRDGNRPLELLESSLRSAFEVLERLREQGRIGAYGAATWSAFRVPETHGHFLALEQLVRIAREVGGTHHGFRAVQAPLNLLERELAEASLQPLGGERRPALAVAHALGLRVFVSAPLASGRLADRAEAALRWLLEVAEVDCVLVGAKQTRHVDLLLELLDAPRSSGRETAKGEGGGEAFVDLVNRDQISGWAVSSRLERIDVSVDGRNVGSARLGGRREDVAQQRPDVPGALESGFTYDFEPEDFSPSSGPLAGVSLEFRAGERVVSRTDPIDVPVQRGEAVGQAAVGSPTPFPREVIRALAELHADEDYGLGPWTHDRMDQAVDELAFCYRRASRQTPGLFRYFGYLIDSWTHFQFLERNFPRVNRLASRSAKDRQGVGTSPIELYVIAHHLATLYSHGVRGPLCELGCFKGFSTSALSYACARLGMRMDAFDSFAGLPDSDSDYYRVGDFEGSRDEVERNVGEFGAPSVVTFHEGFFADTIPHYREQEVACLWMDVDLEVSARQAMLLLPRLARRSCVFSDECPKERFAGGAIAEKPGPDDVITPILDAFGKVGREVAGRFVAGNSGVFYEPSEAMPVLGADSLLRLRDALLEGPRSIVAVAIPEVEMNSRIVGFVDRMDELLVHGWAADAGDPLRQLRLEITRNGVREDVLTADELRSDLLHAGYGDGRHAFTYLWPEPLQSREVGEVAVRELESGTELPFNETELSGQVEHCDGTHVRGWVANLRRLDQIRSVDIYVGGRKVSTLVADEPGGGENGNAGVEGHRFVHHWERELGRDELTRVSVRHADTEVWLDQSPLEEPPYYRLLQTPLFESPFREELIQHRGLEGHHAELVRQMARRGLVTFRIRDSRFQELADRIVRELASHYRGKSRLMDAWKFNRAVAELAYLPEVLELLEILYGRPPIPFQTLNFPVGTQQSMHTDALHFNCRPPRFVSAVWIAFEPIDADNGPLFYHPGSHRLPIIELDDLGLVAASESWGHNYKLHATVIEKLIEQEGLPREEIGLERGEAVVWAANLHHGGAPIRDPSRSRHSQVSHYYFEGVRYYSPMESNVYNGRFVAPDRRDIRTGEPIPNEARFSW